MKPWFLVHTMARCEKRIADFCVRHGIDATLPCYNSPHRYPRKKVVFRKPLFPSYLFVRLEPGQTNPVRQHEHVANLLPIFDQDLFERQLSDILRALETNLGVRLAPAIGEGMRVRIKAGPLQGIEGWVEQRYGFGTVLLRLDFIGQAAAIRLEADLLELI